MTEATWRHAALVGIAVVGTLAGLAAVGLLWFVLTRPVALAQVLSGGL